MKIKETIKKAGIPVIVSGIMLIGAMGLFAQTNKSNQLGPNVKGSIYLGAQYAGETQENGILASQAKVSMQRAVSAAKTAYPGYTVSGVSIENENGYLIYAVQMISPTGKAVDVKIDAGNAKVVATDYACGKENDSEHNDSAYETESQGNENDSEHNDTQGEYE